MKLSDLSIDRAIVETVAILAAGKVEVEVLKDGLDNALAYAAQLKVERDRLVSERDAARYDMALTLQSESDALRAERDAARRECEKGRHACEQFETALADMAERANAAIVERDSLARQIEALERMVERSVV